MKYYVAIAGNIGVGKTTLTRLLSARLGWEPFFEAASENPYLADFYRDMSAWAFHSQVFFLARRLHHHRQLLAHAGSVIQDRTVYEDAEVFASNLHRQGYLSERDWCCYRDLYDALVTLLAPPDLLIYLRASVETLAERIARRGRDFERTLSPTYLAQLNELYEAWIASFRLCPILTIPADDLDFVRTPAHLDLIIARVEDRLRGREEVVFPETSDAETRPTPSQPRAQEA